jgi:integrase
MEGHLVERRGKRGRVWYLVFDTPRERGAKREQQRVKLGSMPKNHALALKRKILAKVDNGTWAKQRRDLTVERFLTDWLDAIEHEVATNTHVRYTGLVKEHVIPRIGKMQLSKVTPRHLGQIYQAVQAKGLSQQTALHVHRALHTAFAYAVQVEGVLSENVVSRIKAPRVDPRPCTSISPERVRTLIDAAKGTRLEAPVMVAVLTGLRRGELLALKWERIDMTKGSLYVAEALEHTRRHSVRFKTPKSQTSRRVVPLAPECVELLRVHKEDQDHVKAEAGVAYSDLDLVFPNPDGAPWPPDSFSVQFGKLARAAGCQGFRFHDLRHAFVTLMLGDGVSIREVSDLAGHSRTAVTLSTYAHAMPGVGRAAVSNLARNLLSAEVAAPP